MKIMRETLEQMSINYITQWQQRGRRYKWVFITRRIFILLGVKKVMGDDKVDLLHYFARDSWWLPLNKFIFYFQLFLYTTFSP
jgi:hypothetical protein